MPPEKRHSKVMFRAILASECRCGNSIAMTDLCAYLDDEVVCEDCWRAGY